MTRFARARGSKASNERMPEEATPWSLMKQQLVEDKQKNETYSHDNVLSSCFMKDAVHKRSFSNPDTNLWEVFDGQVEDSAVSNKDNIKNKTKKGLSTDLKTIVKPKKEKLVKDSCCKVGKEKVLVKGNAFTVSMKSNDVSTVGSKNYHSKIISNVGFKERKKFIDNCNSSGCDTPRNSFENETFREFKNNQNSLEQNKNNFKKGKSFKLPSNNAENSELHEHIKHTKVDISRNSFQNNNRNIKTKRRDFSSDKRNYNWQNSSIDVGGKIVEIADFHGFAVKKEDAQRLHKLRKDLLLKGVPRKEVEVALKAERRRAEKALAREKKAVCFKCRKSGHNMSECPEFDDPSGVCFKCGSTEHSVRDCRVVQNDSFKYAHCFICQEQGHIARQCPDNPRGLYPKGGACKVCGDVTHLKKDCPELINDKEISTLTVGTVNNNSIEVLDEDLNEKKKKRQCSKKTNLVKY